MKYTPRKNHEHLCLCSRCVERRKLTNHPISGNGFKSPGSVKDKYPKSFDDW